VKLRLRIAAAAAALCLATAATASGELLPAPTGQVFFGVTDTGEIEDFQAFADSVGKHPAVIETFHPWGNNLHYALPRWGEAQARPMLHVSTVDDQTGAELITPQGIAIGTSDDYLIRLNSSFGTRQIRAYVRPLGEVNRCLNAWATYTCDGALRGQAYTPYWYKQAFRRIAIIVRGGGSLAEINSRLAATGLPPLDRKAKDGVEPDALPYAPVSMVWSPLPGGSPAIKRNRPMRFYPGGAYVDWVGTDIYSKYPVWKALTRFYKVKKIRRKPFALTEWGVSAGDDPRFVKKVFAWVRKHRRTGMLIYYQDFGPVNSYRIQNYPRSRAVIARNLRQGRYPALPPNPPPPPSASAPTDPNDPVPPTGGTGG
jgi:Glycosyl hydrolase family 26